MNKWGELLGALSIEQARRLLELAVEELVPRGDHLVTEGAELHRMFFVVEGLFRVTIHGLGDGRLTTIGHGEIVGEMSFLDGQLASATVVAEEPSRVLAIRQVDLRALLDDEPSIGATFFQFLATLGARRLRSTLGYLDSHAHSLVSSQVAGLSQVQAPLDDFKDLILSYDKVARRGDAAECTRLEVAIRGKFSLLTTGLNGVVGDESDLGDVAKRVFGKTLQRELLPYLQMTDVARRMYTKPRGYAGDFYTIELIYRDAAGGTDQAGTLIDACFLQEPAARAVRNRRDLVAAEIRRTVDAIGVGPARITSLACGPAREIFDVLAEVDPRRMDLTLVDMDAKAIAFVDEKARELGVRDGLRLVTENLIYLSVGRASLDLPPQDLVYSIGLIDYFSDQLVIKLLNFAHSLLRPGGRVILGNFHPTNPTRGLMDHVLEWTLIHRNEADMNRLYSESAFGRGATSFQYEHQGINIFAECVREA